MQSEDQHGPGKPLLEKKDLEMPFPYDNEAGVSLWRRLLLAPAISSLSGDAVRAAR